jgi:NAD(P)-dependent dehydrogenase (short-subunit alcohol dehydrogenase family)
MINFSNCLDGKVAIVTGGARATGMGHQAALAMAAMGAKIVTTGLTTSRSDLTGSSFHKVGGSASRLDERVAEIKDLGGEAICVSCDVADKQQVEHCVQLAVDTFGGVDIIFNNAGVPTGGGPFAEVPDNAWDIQYDICIKSIVWFTHAAYPYMKARGGGSIINNSSIWADKPLAGANPYVAAKAAILGLTKSLAVELGPDNIRVNAILPGTFVTEINDSRVAMVSEKEGIPIEEVRKRMAEPTSLKRLGRPEEVGALVAFLAGPGAGFITGAHIPISGGVQNGL